MKSSIRIENTLVFSLLSDFLSRRMLIKGRDFRLMAIEENRTDDEECAQSKLERQMKVEQINGSYAGNYDSQGRGESFQYVVSIFDYHGYNQSTTRL